MSSVSGPIGGIQHITFLIPRSALSHRQGLGLTRNCIVKLSLNRQILLAAVVGVLLGAALMQHGNQTPLYQQSLYLAGLVASLFVDLLKMVLVPLVFSSIVVGVANLREHRQMHRVWQLTLGFFGLTVLIAIALGLTAMNLFEPGAHLELSMFADSMQNFKAGQLSLPEFVQQFLHSLFVNPFQALAQGQIMAIVVFALLFGIALVIGGERFVRLRLALQELLELSLLMIGWIMKLAPWGIMALLIKLVATQDLAVLAVLGKFMLVVSGATLLHGVVVLPLLLWLLTGVTPARFFSGAREALITAFATSSSSATLPVTLRCVQQNLKVSPGIAGFVVPLGATINMDGTALYEAAAALFIANLAGVELNLAQQGIVVLMSMLAAIGAPGIPSAGMVTMVMVLQSVGLPAEAIAILLPIDRALDTLRTAVNVEGDLVGSLVVEHWVKRLERSGSA